MNRHSAGRQWYWLVYPLWIAICAALFVAFRELPDPTKRTDRVSNDEARERASAALAFADAVRFRDYEIVHVSIAKRNEVASEPHWLVLFDRRERTGLRDAVVVELRARDGALVAIRDVDPRYAQMGKPMPVKPRLPDVGEQLPRASGQ